MKLAITGTGQIVQTVLPYLKTWGWEPAALCATGRSAGKAQELAKAHDCPAVYTDFAAMLLEVKADAVYLGVPNHLHASMAKQALLAGWNVIIEKPLTSTLREAEELAELVRKQRLFLYEAITTIYQPNYAALKAQLYRIGTVKLVSCNFSQYSSRYDAFRRGEIHPAFDLEKSGGALMDLNLYNLHWMLGLFGTPEQVEYYANMERGIDTSGVLLLQYPDFQAVSLAAKDCVAPSCYIIQGTEGYLLQNTSANQCGEVTLHLNDGSVETFHTPTQHRMEMEFRTFAQQIQTGDLAACYTVMEHSLNVVRAQTQARQFAGIHFPADQNEITGGK
mgnify:CR=1 FL=1